jgi:hypothetical protein
MWLIALALIGPVIGLLLLAGALDALKLPGRGSPDAWTGRREVHSITPSRVARWEESVVHDLEESVVHDLDDDRPPAPR